MKPYTIYFTKQAKRDIKVLSSKQKKKLQDVLLEVIAKKPLAGKRLIGDLLGNYSYRLDLKNRIVYSVDKKSKIIYIKRAKTHYGD